MKNEALCSNFNPNRNSDCNWASGITKNLENRFLNAFLLLWGIKLDEFTHGNLPEDFVSWFFGNKFLLLWIYTSQFTVSLNKESYENPCCHQNLNGISEVFWIKYYRIFYKRGASQEKGFLNPQLEFKIYHWCFVKSDPTLDRFDSLKNCFKMLLPKPNRNWNVAFHRNFINRT